MLSFVIWVWGLKLPPTCWELTYSQLAPATPEACPYATETGVGVSGDIVASDETSRRIATIRLNGVICCFIIAHVSFDHITVPIIGTRFVSC